MIDRSAVGCVPGELSQSEHCCTRRPNTRKGKILVVAAMHSLPYEGVTTILLILQQGRSGLWSSMLVDSGRWSVLRMYSVLGIESSCSEETGALQFSTGGTPADQQSVLSLHSWSPTMPRDGAVMTRSLALNESLAILTRHASCLHPLASSDCVIRRISTRQPSTV